MEYLSQEAILRNVLLQLNQVEISHLCSQLLGSCEMILEDRSFWKEKLEDQGIDSRLITSPIQDYKLVYQLIANHPNKTQLFLEAIKNRHHDLYKVLIESGYIDKFCEGLKIAINDHSLDIVTYLLFWVGQATQSNRLQPLFIQSDCSGDLIFDAAVTGDLRMVDLLMNRFVIPTIAIVSFLSLGGKPRHSPFPNPRVTSKQILNFREVSLRLLSSTTSRDPSILYYSLLTGDSEIIMKLLPHPSAALENNLLIRLAAEDRLIDVLRTALQDPLVDPSAMNNQALCRAAHHGYFEIVELLLTSRKVLSNQQGLIKAYQMASLQNHDEVRDLLYPYIL